MSGIEKAADFDDCGLTAFASAIRKLFSVPLTKSVLKTPKSRYAQKKIKFAPGFKALAAFWMNT